MERNHENTSELYVFSHMLARLASMQYSVSNLMLLYNGQGLDMEDDMLSELRGIDRVLENEKVALIRIEDEYKRRAWKRK